MDANEIGYETVEHTADIGILAHGRTIEDVFAAAAQGMFDLIAKNKNVAAKIEREIHIEREDLIMLFKQWLEELLVLFDTEKLVFSEFKVSIDKKNDLYKLNAKVRGERYDPEKHGSGIEIKAVTYHMMDIWEEDGKYYGRVIFDI